MKRSEKGLSAAPSRNVRFPSQPLGSRELVGNVSRDETGVVNPCKCGVSICFCFVFYFFTLLSLFSFLIFFF